MCFKYHTGTSQKHTSHGTASQNKSRVMSQIREIKTGLSESIGYPQLDSFRPFIQEGRLVEIPGSSDRSSFTTAHIFPDYTSVSTKLHGSRKVQHFVDHAAD